MKSKHFIITNPSSFPQKCIIPLVDYPWDEQNPNTRIIDLTESTPLVVEEFRISEHDFNIVQGISSSSDQEPDQKLPTIRISSVDLFTFEKAFASIEKIFKEKLISSDQSAVLKTIASLVMEKQQPKRYNNFPDHLYFDDEKNNFPVSPMMFMSAYQIQSHIVEGSLKFDIESCNKMTVVGIPPNTRHSIIIYIKQK